MNQRNYGMYALAAAIVVVGALIAGASLESFVWLALVAACPLMMFFMMRGMHGQDMHRGHSRYDRHDNPLHKDDQHQHPGSGRR
ncbi:DUF2933 domain-containing protein [Streptomyces xiangluensis]|uniref:DUF2933 domain-containing protein n=1 Tax=Streptomyces xiangluensis TaxID=2665720 RepID=A0ABV8YE10_9ACTN